MLPLVVRHSSLRMWRTERLEQQDASSVCGVGRPARDNRRVSDLNGLPCPRVLPVQDMPVRALVAARELGLGGVKPTGKALSASEANRVEQLAEQGALLAREGASWGRLQQRGGECLV